MRTYTRIVSILLPVSAALCLSNAGCYVSETGLCWNGTSDVARPYELPTAPDRIVYDADTFTDSEGVHDSTMMLEIWDCSSPAWWYDAPPRKVVFEYHNTNGCARYDTVKTWELECGAVSDVEVQHGDLDQDGLTLASGDCDDAAPDRYPGALDYCNDGIDQDCDGLDSIGEDLDKDGFYTCSSDLRDCNDLSADIYPGAEEVCDGIDNDCSGSTDDGLAAPLTFDAPAETEVNDILNWADDLVANEEGIFRVQGSISSSQDNDYFRFQLMGSAGETVRIQLDLYAPSEAPAHSVQLVSADEQYQNAVTYTQTDGGLHAEFDVAQDDTGQTMGYALVKDGASSCHAYLLEIAYLAN